MAFCLLLVIVAELPHLRDDAWEDEAATLMLFASGTPLDAFRDYRLPNNHMLFSATLAAWWSRGESVEHARLLPALAWVLSMVLMVMGGRRLLGWPAAAVGIGVWSGAALTAFFALALRGYAFSWPFVLTVFACAPGWVSERAWRAGLATAAAGALAFMILPTNGIALASALAFALLCDARAHGRLRGTACMRALTALALAAGGLVVYVPHRAAMMAHMQGGFSTWSSIEIMTHWWLAASSQCLPLLPVLAWGAWRARRAPAQDPARAALDLALVLMVVPLCAVAASPVALVPRALVPLLPLWCLALGGLLAAAVSAPQLRCRVSVTAGCALLVVAAFACGRAMPDCAAAPWRFPPGDDLCHPVFRHGYYPAAVLQAIADHYPGVPVLVSARDVFAFSFINWNGAARAAVFFDRGTWLSRHAGPRPRWVVADSAQSARAMVGEITREQPRAVTEALRVGWLSVQQFSWR
ncbi:MAG: hypothetical protein IT492_22495 [Gammaproteobacteria bacterium]|nr:hypothetical protein [Gammaproteobacteria bacterium]